MSQQARNLAWKLQEETLQTKFLLRDCDCKFTASFDRIFRSEGVEVLRCPSGELDRGEVRGHMSQRGA